MSIGYSEGRIEKISEGSGMHQMIRVSLNLSLPIESEVIDLFYLFQLPNGLYFDDYELERNWQYQHIRLSIQRDRAPYEDLILDHGLILPQGLTGIEFLSLNSTGSLSCSSSSQGKDCCFHHDFFLPIHQQYHQATLSTVNSRIERKLSYPLVFIRPSVDGRLVDTRRCQEMSYLGKATAELGSARTTNSDMNLLSTDEHLHRCVHLASLLQAYHNRVEEEAMKGQGSPSLPAAACSAAQMMEWNRWIGGYNPVIIREPSNALVDRIPSQHEVLFHMPVGSLEDLPLVSTVTLAAVISSALVLLLFIFKLKNTA